MKNVIISITTCIFALLVTTMPVCAAEHGTEYGTHTEEGNADQHEAWEIITTMDPTCTECGIVVYRDSDGKQIIERTETSEHTPGEWSIMRAPGAFSHGIKIKACTACGTIVDTEILEPKYNLLLITVIIGTLVCGIAFMCLIYLRWKRW